MHILFEHIQQSSGLQAILYKPAEYNYGFFVKFFLVFFCAKKKYILLIKILTTILVWVKHDLTFHRYDVYAKRFLFEKGTLKHGSYLWKHYPIKFVCHPPYRIVLVSWVKLIYRGSLWCFYNKNRWVKKNINIKNYLNTYEMYILSYMKDLDIIVLLSQQMLVLEPCWCILKSQSNDNGIHLKLNLYHLWNLKID